MRKRSHSGSSCRFGPETSQPAPSQPAADPEMKGLFAHSILHPMNIRPIFHPPSASAPVRLSACLLVLLVAFGLRAEEPAASTPPKLEGTWKWAFQMPDGTKAQPKVKLK